MLYVLLLWVTFILPSTATDINEVKILLEQYRSVPNQGGIAPAVLLVKELTSQLKEEADPDKALKRIHVLRRLISQGEGVGGIRTHQSHGDKCYANMAEREVLFNAISTVEMAAALGDGHYSFSFCSHEQDKPSGGKKKIPGAYISEDTRTLEGRVKDIEEQKHLTMVYALARAIHANLASAKTEENLPIFIRRGVNSRHLPLWMKQIYKGYFYDNKAFNSQVWNIIRGSEEKLKSLKLYQVRAQQKNKDMRKSFKIKNKPSEEMMAFATNPNHGCYWYATSYDYGYEEPWDMIELLIDNLPDEPDLIASFLQYIVEGFYYDNHKRELLRKKTDTFFTKNFSLTLDRFWQQVGNGLEMEKKPIFQKISFFLQKDPSFLYEILDDIIKESKQNLYRIRMVGTNLPFLIQELILNQRQVIEWRPTQDNKEIELRGFYQDLVAGKPLLEFNHVYSNKNHATALIPKEITTQSIIDWVKATQREKETGIKLTPHYITNWM